jgi:hypothetical protein
LQSIADITWHPKEAMGRTNPLNNRSLSPFRIDPAFDSLLKATHPSRVSSEPARGYWLRHSKIEAGCSNALKESAIYISFEQLMHLVEQLEKNAVQIQAIVERSSEDA